MEVHKFTVYALDFEGYGAKEIERSFDHGSLSARVFYNGSADIGKWEDDHELNKAGSTQLTFDKYFA